MRKPDAIVYWLSDKLPARFAFGLALQQTAFLGALLVVPSLFAHSNHFDHFQFLDIAAATLITSAVGLVLQAWNRFGIGSGYFYPLQPTPAVLPALLLAVQTGGPTAAFGMVFALAITQLVFSGFIAKLRSIFTVEIAGLAVLLIGLGLGQGRFEAYRHTADRVRPDAGRARRRRADLRHHGCDQCVAHVVASPVRATSGSRDRGIGRLGIGG